MLMGICTTFYAIEYGNRVRHHPVNARAGNYSLLHIRVVGHEA